MDIAMWAKALQVIPRLSKDEWTQLDVVSRWLVATRAAVLVMTFISAAIAGLLAARDGAFEPVAFVLVTVGLLMAHATNNLVNDLTDHWKGVDRDNYFRAQYGPQPLEHGLTSQREHLVYVAVTGAMALAAGIPLILMRGQPVLLLTLSGVFFVLFYTWPLKYIGLGEIAVLLVWGPLMIGGGYFTITGSWEWNAVIASMPYALATTTVLFGKHIDKLEADRAKKIRTLPVLLGERASRGSVIAMLFLQYGLVVYLVAIRFFTPVMLVVLLAATTLRVVVPAYRKPRPTEMPADYRADVWPLWFVAFAFLHTRRFGMLFLLGLIGDVVARRFLSL